MVCPTKAVPPYLKMSTLKHTNPLASMDLPHRNGELLNRSNLHQVLPHLHWELVLDGIAH